MRWTLISDEQAAPATIEPAAIFDSARAVLVADLDHAAMLISTPSWGRAIDWATTLRGTPQLTRLPLYLSTRPAGEAPELDAALFDGVGLADAERETHALAIFDEGQRFAHRASAPGEALAQYLACRPGARLQPIRDWRAAAYYRYPIVEALLGPGESAFVWLERWSQRLVLDTDVVIDRLRLCDTCHSAHLSYLDICPACSSLDIVSTRLLHCFTCSHVGPQEAFQNQHSLRCPKCEAVLRHIGVDYDRPIEQQQCRHCKHLFVDADVQSVCMACGTRNSPDALPARIVASYRLGGAGLLLARQGNLSPVLSGLDTVNYIAPALFERLIEWQVALAARYPESHYFSVIGLRVANLPELVEAIGRSRTAALVDAFAERLRATLRTCDLTTRGDEHVWILAPHTDGATAQMLIGRISALSASTQQENRSALRLLGTACCIPADEAMPTEGNQLMGLLAARLERAPE